MSTKPYCLSWGVGPCVARDFIYGRMDADSSDVLVMRVISVSSEATVATRAENADTKWIEMGGVEAR